MGTVALDFSKAIPIGGAPPTPDPADNLQSAVSYAVQQDPVQHAKLLRLQQQLGIAPAVSQGNEQQVQQAADVNSINYPRFAAQSPRTTAWGSNNDNAAVAQPEGLLSQAQIEKHAAAMRTSTDGFSAYTPTFAENIQAGLRNSWNSITKAAYDNPLTRLAISTVGGTVGLAGDVASEVGWTGNGPTGENLLQRVESGLKPENVFADDPYVGLANYAKSNGMDKVAPIVAGLGAGFAEERAIAFGFARLGWSAKAAKLASLLAVGTTFAAQSGGQTYVQSKTAGGSDQTARSAADTAFAINEGPDVLAGFLDRIPGLNRAPLLASAIGGGLMGGAGQLANNLNTGQPWSTNLPSQMAQGAAMQAGLHIGLGMAAGGHAEPVTQAPASIPPEFANEFRASPFLSNLAGAVDVREQSQLAKLAPDKFHEANQANFEGDPSIRIPADKFSEYFTGKGQEPGQVASGLDSTNYAEAVLSGGDVEIPAPSFLSKLDPEHQKTLLPDVKDPNWNMTAREFQEGRAELEQWATGGGVEKLSAEMDAADAETAESPDFQAVKEELRQRYVDAGETPEVAETLATKDANVYSNLARNANLKPSELVALYNPKIVSAEAPDGEVLSQSGADGQRGWFRVLPDGTYEIGKTPAGDLSTFVHEPAHAYLRMIGDLSKRDGASDTLKGDYQKILEYLGAKDGEALTGEQQETWARANEQYLREGRAPSQGLKGTFQRFAIWLGSVYKHARDLGVTLSDDIRGVFDRLYASEEGVDKAEAESGPRLFATAEEAGWNDVQFKVYADMNHVSVEQAKAQILGMMNDAALREKTDAWREEEKNVRTAVTADIDSSPEYSAIRALRRGSLDDGTSFTLSREELVNQFGEDRVRELRKKHPGLYRNEGGLDPETAAEILGFNSAENMVRQLEVSPRRSAIIEQATREYMTAKHGDIRYDGTLDDQARIALENDKRADSLHSELAALKKKLADVKDQVAGQKQDMRAITVAPIEAYREAAQQMIEAKAIADIQPTRYMDASRKYGRAAFDALRSGDTLKAEQAKHKELMNHFLFREATKAREYVGKFESYAKRMQARGVQEKLGLAGDDYRDQFNRILERYRLGPSVPPPARPLTEWAAAQYEQGKEPAIDPAILNEVRNINYRNAPVAEIRMVHDALINIRKLASLELAMEVNGRKIEFAAAMTKMDAQAHTSLKTKPTRVLEQNRTASELATNFLQRGDALMARTEFLMKRLDGGVSGPWHDNLWNLAADAQGHEYRLQEEVTKRIGTALESMPKEQRMKMLDKVTVDGIHETVTRKDLISMAFNMGNEGNLDRLAKTFVQHGWEPRAIENIQGMLTREEWQFVQDGWDSLKPLGQAQSELEKRLTGLPPVMVKPMPLQLRLADGTEMDLAGGYYPVVMDPRFSARGATQDAGTTAQNLMEAGYGRAATSRGNMKERTGFGGAMQLDYEQVLTQHTAKVIKDITHREFMLVANKLLLDPQIRQTLRETLGQGYEEKMMPWLRTIINDRNGSAVQGLGDVSRWMGKLRTNVVKASLGFKASTMLLQLTHASSIFLHTSPGSYAQAMIKFLAHPSEMTEEIRNLSPNEMQNRVGNIDRDMRQVLQEGIGKQSVSKVIARAGMFPVKMMDHVLSFPLWDAVYQDSLKENVDLPEKDAQYIAMHKADGAVRMGLGSNAPKDLPPVMRNNDFLKIITTLGGFHNLKWNQMADVGGSFARNRNLGQFTYRMMMAAIIPAVVGAYVTGRKPKDDENAGLWAAKRALLFAPETVPLVGDATQAIFEGGDAKFTPLMNVAEKAAMAGHGALSDNDEKDWTGIGLDAGEATGEFFGVPGTEQAVKTARYAHRVQLGKVDDPNAWEAVVGAAHK